MAGQALYRKYRPTTFDDVIGQEHVVQTLLHAIQGGRIAHAYLFSGPRGTGKTTTARLLARALGCSDLDLVEIDAASNNSVEDVRDLRDKINFSPNEGDYKVYIIDEVHMLSKSAFNALLKTLEEPPAHAVFVLATTELDRVPATVKSRCQRHTFRRITTQDIVSRLQTIIAAEGIQIEAGVLPLVARQATGSMRDAISLLDQLIVSTDDMVTMVRALDVLGAADNRAVLTLTDALAASDTAAGLDAITLAIDAGSDPRQFARQVVDYLRGVLLSQLGSADQIDVDVETRTAMQTHARQIDSGRVVRAMQHFNDASNDTSGGWLTQLPLELAFVECLGMAPTLVAAPVLVSAPPRAAAVTPTPAAPPAPTMAPPAADSPAEPTSPTAGEAPPAAISIAALAGQWKQVQARSRAYHPALHALMDWFRPVEAQGNTILIGFEKQVFLDKMNSDTEMRQHTESLLSEFVGQPVQVKCVLKSGIGDSELPDIKDEGVVAMGVKLGARPRPRNS